MISRVNNIEEYVKKINNSGLVDDYFPKLSKILKDKNFLTFLKTESKKGMQKRTLNSDLLVFKKIYQYCRKENKTDFTKECEILKSARSTKQSPIVKEIKKLTCNKTLIK